MPSWLSQCIHAQFAGMTDNSKLSNFSTPNTVTTKLDESLPLPVLQTNAGNNHTRRIHRKTARFDGLVAQWAVFKRHIGTGTAPSSSSQIGESAVEHTYTQKMETIQMDGSIDEVVVDRVWGEELKSLESQSDHGASPEKFGENHHFNQGGSDHESLVYEGFWSMSSFLAIIRWRTWPFIMEIFSSRFVDEKSEQHYAQVRNLMLISLCSMSI